MIEPRFEHVMSYTAQLAAPEVIGAVPDDLRINFYVTGGTVTGPKVAGKIRPVGGDWLTLRKDGVSYPRCPGDNRNSGWCAGLRHVSGYDRLWV